MEGVRNLKGIDNYRGTRSSADCYARVLPSKKLTDRISIMGKYKTKKRELYYDKVIELYQEKGYGCTRISKFIPVSERSIWWRNRCVPMLSTR
ncbi:hypothetical protein [Porphyromonas macacae]|uniref:hypothetical protein n=1 Tax=Porphyromonas macacae TaxID=28115 RepID=UPI00359F9F86